MMMIFTCYPNKTNPGFTITRKDTGDTWHASTDQAARRIIVELERKIEAPLFARLRRTYGDKHALAWEHCAYRGQEAWERFRLTDDLPEGYALLIEAIRLARNDFSEYKIARAFGRAYQALHSDFPEHSFLTEALDVLSTLEAAYTGEARG